MSTTISGSAIPGWFVLGSRSPRRLELLRLVVPANRIEVVPPTSADEPGFEGLVDWPTIQSRLREIARGKCHDVVKQLAGRSDGVSVVVTADTVIVADAGARRLVALGQPPETDEWPDVVRHWFRDYYAGKTHRVATALCVSFREGALIERVAVSEVTFRPDVERLLDWYLATGEPCGKAGGYALQGAGSVFITRVEGSLSNIVGLPLEDLADCLGVAAPSRTPMT